MSKDKKAPAAEKAPTRRKAPKLEMTAEREMNVQLEDTGQLKTLYGTDTDAAAEGILRSALNALGTAGLDYMNLMTTMAIEMEPRDAVEAMLVSQMTATHVAMTATSQKMADAPSYQLREAYERSMTRLSRTFLSQVDGLKKYRAKAQQIVRVERVEVQDGGQAIVGDVSYRRGEDDEK
ncbi:hypothetical protein [Ovoidimarina sediminis]|uniref:hypothetical protein n=1 Tax=Ovoidimarina sediminis TaxID=3079856 RepID=UPI002912EBE3|nr:hypothetical protein [Rhodophyticola sp. MJ-SS7]MDU8942381.1 hypothetical protein [Rhodophyticola sp. MJ-SS7]